MSFSVFLSPKSIADIDYAFDYYNQQSPGLGFEFANTIDAFFRKIGQVPTASAIRYENVRVKPVHIFPYTIHYIIDEEKKQVTILRLFNTWQDPFWNK
jgi:plasmid stabilization system protein ParE